MNENAEYSVIVISLKKKKKSPQKGKQKESK